MNLNLEYPTAFFTAKELAYMGGGLRRAGRGVIGLAMTSLAFIGGLIQQAAA